MKTERIQLSRAKGWRMPPNTINCARPTKWGNLYTVAEFGLPLAITLYRRTIEGIWSPSGIPDALIDRAYEVHCELQRRLQLHWANPASLRGYNLACWCRLDAQCHVDALLELANS